MDNHSSIQGMAIKGMVGMEDCCCSQIPVVIECFLMLLCQQHWIEPLNRQSHSQYLISMRKFFSEYSYGFRPGRSCHDAIRQALSYLNEGYEWVIDIGIEQFFDKVNHDKLIQILREQVNDSTTLNLIRKYLKVGVVEKGLEKATIKGVPQGGPLSVVCSNVYLDKLDKELEQRGLRFTRYADDGAPRRRVQVA